jgi:hypothetical protein
LIEASADWTVRCTSPLVHSTGEELNQLSWPDLFTFFSAQADTLRDMLDDPRNQESEYSVVVGGRYHKKYVDVIWEVLWLMCQRMEEQRG